jgi:hypothetical protein
MHRHDDPRQQPRRDSESQSQRTRNVNVVTFVEKHRFGGGRGEKAWLKMSWEGEIFGVGMMEAMAEMYPEHADEATAGATMEWFNIHVLEDFGHQAGVHVSLEDAEKLGGRERSWRGVTRSKRWRSSRRRRLQRPTRCTRSSPRALAHRS